MQKKRSSPLWDLFSKIFPLSIVAASMLGSGHCVAMCGAFPFIVGKEKSALYFYHLGRLFSYSFLGAFAASLGKSLFSAALYRWTALGSAVFLLLCLLWLAYRLWTKQSPHSSFQPPWQKFSPQLLAKISQNFSALPKMKSLFIGMSSVLLPCGFLYTYIFLAASTQNTFAGLAVMFFFWLGTLPAFALLAGGKKILQRKFSSRTLQRASSTLILMGCLALIMVKIIPLLESPKMNANPVCVLHN